MDQNIKKLQYLPYGTKEHQIQVKKIQKELKYKDFVLCMEGKFSEKRNQMADNNISRISQQVDFITLDSVFPNAVETVYASKNFFFVHRNQAEYNLDYRQVNVGLLIVDENNKTAVIRKNNGYLSLIGGHTDFNKDSYDMTVEEMTRFNVVKEFKEEIVTNLDPELIPASPLFFITEGADLWDFFHCWFIYLVPVKDINDYTFTSGEKDKHVVEIIDIDELLNDPKAKVKTSLKQSLEMYSDSFNNKTSTNPSGVKVEKTEPIGSYSFQGGSGK